MELHLSHVFEAQGQEESWVCQTPTLCGSPSLLMEGVGGARISSEVAVACVPRARGGTSPCLISGISVMFRFILSPRSVLGRTHAVLLTFQRGIILTHFINLRKASQSSNRKELRWMYKSAFKCILLSKMLR